MFKSNIKLVGYIKNTGSYKLIDYYFVLPCGTLLYVCTRKYTYKCFNTCKGGIRVTNLLKIKSRDTAIMKLINYVKFVTPYFKSEYGLI